MNSYKHRVVFYAMNIWMTIFQSQMTDATFHSAWKFFLCKLDSSQAYHYVEMADVFSVRLCYLILHAERSPTNGWPKV